MIRNLSTHIGREFRAQLRSGAGLVLSTVVAGGLSYAALTIGARLLGPADFGLIGVLLAIAGLATLAFQPLYTTAAYVVGAARDTTAGRQLAGPATALAAGLALALSLLTTVLIEPIGQLLASPTSPLLVALGPLLAALALAHMTRGLVVGQQRFTALSFIIVLDALVRAVCIWPLTLLIGVTGSITAYVVGSVASSGLAIWRCGGLGWSLRPVAQARGVAGVGIISLIVTLSSGALQNLDLVLLRTYTSADEVGWYALAAAAGNLLLALATPLFLPVYPRLVSARIQGRAAWAVLAPALLSILVLGAAAAVAGMVFGAPLIELLFGPAFVGAAQLLPIYLVKTTALLLLIVVGQYCASHGRLRAALVAVVPVVLGLVSVAVLHPTPATVALVMTGSAFAAQLVIVFAGLGMSSAGRHHVRNWRGRAGDPSALRMR